MALIGNIAVVAGGSRGIGRATAIELARQGADVGIIYRSADDAAAAVCAEIVSLGRRALAIRADASDASAVASAFASIRAELGLPAMVVNSIGAASQEKYIHDLSPDEFRAFIAVDLFAAYNVIHTAVRTLREAGGGIVAMSSIATQMMPTRNGAGAASKAATEALIKVVAREEARHAIRANAVSIGITDTDMVRPLFAKWGDAATSKILAGMPLGRIGQPQEVASMIAYLLDERASYITGKVFQVDGGQFIGG